MAYNEYNYCAKITMNLLMYKTQLWAPDEFHYFAKPCSLKIGIGIQILTLFYPHDNTISGQKFVIFRVDP